MTASPVRALPDPPCVDPACPRAIAPATSLAFSASVPAAPPDPPRMFQELPQEAPAATNPARALPLPVPRGPLPHLISLRAPCRSRSPPDPAPSTPRRAPHTPLPCISKLPPSRTGSPPVAPIAAQFPSCPRRLAQSSEYSSAA